MKRKLNKKKVIIFVLIILIFILTIVFSVLYRNNLTIRVFFDEYIFRKNITENTLPKISTESGYTYAYEDYIVCLEKNVLTFYNKSASKVSSLDLEVSNEIEDLAKNKIASVQGATSVFINELMKANSGRIHPQTGSGLSRCHDRREYPSHI